MARSGRTGRSGKAALAVGLVCCVLFSATLLGPLNAKREEAGLTVAAPLENAPPVLVLAINALGAFRGIIIDLLWIRAMDLKQEGQYFELAQIYDWIGTLEPRLPSIWVHNAWNMAYNISVGLPSPRDRWLWVSGGIEMLKKRGLRYNPDSALIAREIGSIYQHKIGGLTDDHHLYYKVRLAREVEELLGPDPDIAAFAAALAAGEAVLAEEEVRALREDLAAAGMDVEADYLGALAGEAGQDEAVEAILSDPLRQAARTKLENFLRAGLVRDELVMDLELMLKMEARFGDMDWRLPEAHSLYWGMRSIEISQEGEFRANYFRMVYHSLHGLVERGRLHLLDDVPAYLPEVRFVMPLDDFFREIIEEFGATQPGLRRIREEFLKESVFFCATNNRADLAGELLTRLRDDYDSKEAADVDAFLTGVVRKAVIDSELATINAFIASYLFMSIRAEALEEADLAEGYLEFAMSLYGGWQDTYGDRERMRLPPLADLRDKVVEGILSGRAPVEPPVYDMLRKQYGPAGAAPGHP